jgi:hypothetical protein
MPRDLGVWTAEGCRRRSALGQLTEATEMAGRLAGKVCVITDTGGSTGRAADCPDAEGRRSTHNGKEIRDVV